MSEKTPNILKYSSAFYRVSIRSISDYSPFGVQLSGRTISAENYRFGFNGMEADSEVKGDGNSYDFGARLLDPRLGRWLTIDPLAAKYSSISPYTFVANNPILLIDPDGKKIIIHYDSGEKDSDNQPIMKSYEYGSGLSVPDNEFVKATIETIDYLKSNGVGVIKGTETNIIDELSYSDDKNVNINFTNKLTNDGHYQGDIDWNPNSGLLVKGRQSPALGLLHEMGHAWGYLLDNSNYNKRKNNVFKIDPEQPYNYDPDLLYQNGEEKFVIENIETPAAIKLGEGTRNDHLGKSFETSAPTSTKTKTEVQQEKSKTEAENWLQSLPKDFFNKIK